MNQSLSCIQILSKLENIFCHKDLQRELLLLSKADLCLFLTSDTNTDNLKFEISYWSDIQPQDITNFFRVLSKKQISHKNVNKKFGKEVLMAQEFWRKYRDESQKYALSKIHALIVGASIELVKQLSQKNYILVSNNPTIERATSSLSSNKDSINFFKLNLKEVMSQEIDSQVIGKIDSEQIKIPNPDRIFPQDILNSLSSTWSLELIEDLIRTSEYHLLPEHPVSFILIPLAEDGLFAALCWLGKKNACYDISISEEDLSAMISLCKGVPPISITRGLKDRIYIKWNFDELIKDLGLNTDKTRRNIQKHQQISILRKIIDEKTPEEILKEIEQEFFIAPTSITRVKSSLFNNVKRLLQTKFEDLIPRIEAKGIDIDNFSDQRQVLEALKMIGKYNF